MDGKSSVRLVHCYIAARDGETIIYDKIDGSLHINLAGYAVIPLEEFSSDHHARNVSDILRELVPLPTPEQSQ